MDDVTEQRRESPTFNAAMLLVTQGLVALITVVVLYFWQVVGPGCPDNQCFAIWAVNTYARWTLILLFIATLVATIILQMSGRPTLRVPLIGVTVSAAVAVTSLALVFFLPGGVGSF